MNGWDADKKLQWLKVRLTGRVQKAFQRLPEASRATFDLAKEALTERFEPKSRKTRYQAEFQARKKKPSEGWADFADDLQSLAEKAYPTLQHEARELLAINAYLQQLTQPQVAFCVKRQTQGHSMTQWPQRWRWRATRSLLATALGHFHSAAGERDRYCRRNRTSGKAHPHGGAAERTSGDATARSLADEASTSRWWPRPPPDGSREQTGAGEPKAQAAAEGV